MWILTIIFGILMFIWMGISIHDRREIEKRDILIKELERDLKILKDEEYQQRKNKEEISKITDTKIL